MFRKVIFGGLMLLAASGASAQAPRPPVGGIGSPPDAMIFYVAHGAPDACGPGCSTWIAAEGTVQWDTHKRLFNILDRNAGRRLPLVIHVWGESNLSVATSLGRILRERNIDTTVGITETEVCKGKSEPECFALKRTGGPLEAKVKSPDAPCDLTCVLMLAGGVHRSLPAGSRVVLSGMVLRNRMAPNVSQEARDTLPERYGEQFRKYLRDMGVETELLDIVDRQGETRRAVEMPPAEWTRLHIVN
ncbi:MAG: hypothetical protein GY844_19090 [Bradyrhizobium sp.]|nr:hypothetical protein [Bradyrhizobium sp.]